MPIKLILKKNNKKRKTNQLLIFFSKTPIYINYVYKALFLLILKTILLPRAPRRISAILMVWKVEPGWTHLHIPSSRGSFRAAALGSGPWRTDDVTVPARADGPWKVHSAHVLCPLASCSCWCAHGYTWTGDRVAQEVRLSRLDAMEGQGREGIKEQVQN